MVLRISWGIISNRVENDEHEPKIETIQQLWGRSKPWYPRYLKISG
jgi:hypothetical protein